MRMEGRRKGKEKDREQAKTGPLLGNIKESGLFFKESYRRFDQAMGHNNFYQLDLKDH